MPPSANVTLFLRLSSRFSIICGHIGSFRYFEHLRTDARQEKLDARRVLVERARAPDEVPDVGQERAYAIQIPV